MAVLRITDSHDCQTLPLVGIAFLLSFIIGIAVMSLPSKGKISARILDWFTLVHCFLMSIFWVYLICEEVINLLRVSFDFSCDAN